MVNEQFRQLLRKLSDATARGKIAWEETADENMFRTALGQGMVRIGKSHFQVEDETSVPAYTAVLLDSDGSVADELEVASGQDFVVMEALFNMARQQARNAEDLLKSMLNELETK